MLQNIQRI